MQQDKARRRANDQKIVFATNCETLLWNRAGALLSSEQMGLSRLPTLQLAFANATCCRECDGSAVANGLFPVKS
jgi:hypothetical protein